MGTGSSLENKKELAEQAIQVFPQESIVFHNLSQMPELEEAIESVDATAVDPAKFEQDSKKFKLILETLHGLAGHGVQSTEGLDNEKREEAIAFLTQKVENYNKIIEALR